MHGPERPESRRPVGLAPGASRRPPGSSMQLLGARRGPAVSGTRPSAESRLSAARRGPAPAWKVSPEPNRPRWENPARRGEGLLLRLRSQGVKVMSRATRRHVRYEYSQVKITAIRLRNPTR